MDGYQLSHTDKNLGAEELYSHVPLSIAAYFGMVHLVDLLLRHGASVNLLSGKYKATPLHFALYNWNCDIAKMLLDAEPPCNVPIKDAEGNTALHLLATEERHGRRSYHTVRKVNITHTTHTNTTRYTLHCTTQCKHNTHNTTLHNTNTTRYTLLH